MNRLPQALVRLLDGTDLEAKIGETFLLLTVDAVGFPHVALLSVGEVVAVSERELRLALWPGTNSGKNLARDGQATLAVFREGAAYYVKFRARRLGDLPAANGVLAVFGGRVESAREDRVA